jgi:hypothetical protein
MLELLCIFPAFPPGAGLNPDGNTDYPGRIETAISWANEGKKETREKREEEYLTASKEFDILKLFECSHFRAHLRR